MSGHATRTPPHTQQIEDFVDAMIANPNDHALRLVLADFLAEKAGWSEADVLPLRDGSLTGRHPYNPGVRRSHGWVTDKPTPPVASALPAEVFEHLPRLDNQPRFKDRGDLKVWVAPHDSMEVAWGALRTALVAWATRQQAPGDVL